MTFIEHFKGNYLTPLHFEGLIQVTRKSQCNPKSCVGGGVATGELSKCGYTQATVQNLHTGAGGPGNNCCNLYNINGVYNVQTETFLSFMKACAAPYHQREPFTEPMLYYSLSWKWCKTQT